MKSVEECVEPVSRAFLRLLAEQVGPDQVLEVARLNAAEPNPGVCHSHDLCDANVLMAQAIEEVAGPAFHVASDDHVRLWGLAWDEAKKLMQEFDPGVASRPRPKWQ